ncbi:MAG: ABC transporter permease [Burkholderiales bacterium]
MNAAAWRVARATLAGSRGRGRIALAIAAIALGVALAVAVHLVNASALAEMRAAAATLAGESDLAVRAPREGFDETLYPQLAQRADIMAAAPSLEADVALAGRSARLRVIGLDPFRALQVQPRLVAGWEARVMELLAPDAVLLSPAAAAALHLATGDTFEVVTGSAAVRLRVIGTLPVEAYPQPLAVMDIAAAQQLFARFGRLNRIDLKLAVGTDPETLAAALARELPPGVELAPPTQYPGAELSRAYRTNLDALALVALFTGGFLVFSTQALAVLRRRTQFALARALGLTRTRLIVLIVGECAVVGVLGAAAGVALGAAAARLILDHLGGDLGAGYFGADAVPLAWSPPVLAALFLLGVLAAVAGGWLPAMEAARRAPAAALRAGDEEDALERLRPATPGWCLMAGGLACAFLPAVAGMPLAGYLAVILLLLGMLWLLPAAIHGLLDRLPAPRTGMRRLAWLQLAGAPGQASIALAATVTATALAIGMLLMISSFRDSLDGWLTHMLPADLYVRMAGSDVGALSPQAQRTIAATPGVAAAAFLRSQPVLTTPGQPAVVVLARSDAPRHLPLLGRQYAPAAGEPPPAWVSEVFSARHGARAGERLELPLAGRRHTFTVAGVWRDYARQTGAVVIDLATYRILTGDALATEAALLLAPGAGSATVEQALKAALGPGLETAAAATLRRESFRIFDRTFAVTYALTASALAIGMLGVSAAFAAQALARRRGFGVLRTLGATRGQLARLLAAEGAALGVLGAGIGSVLGLAIGLVLIHVINRQSFHWSMDLHVPWLALAGFAAGLVAACALAAVAGGRAALSTDAVNAVREDW